MKFFDKLDPQDVRATIAEARRAIEVPYLRAKKQVEAPEWPDVQAGLVQRLKVIIAQAKADPHEALVALGQAKEIVRQLDEPADVIAQYTNLGDQLRQIRVPEKPQG